MALSPFNYNLPTSIKSGSTYKFNFQAPARTPNDIVKLGDFTFPGVSRVEITRARKVQIKKGKGGIGDTVVDSGLEIATVKIYTRIFFENEYTEMERILDFFETKVGKGKGSTANSFALINPDARMRRVFNIFIESIEGPINHMPAAYTDFVFNCKEVIKTKNQTPKRQKPAPQKQIETTTPERPDITGNPPSKDPAVTGPRRTKKP